MSHTQVESTSVDEDVASSECFSECTAELLADTEDQIHWHKKQILDFKLKQSKAPFFFRGFYDRKIERVNSSLSQLVFKRQQYLA